jgi:hypothetical protein
METMTYRRYRLTNEKRRSTVWAVDYTRAAHMPSVSQSEPLDQTEQSKTHAQTRYTASPSCASTSFAPRTSCGTDTSINFVPVVVIGLNEVFSVMLRGVYSCVSWRECRATNMCVMREKLKSSCLESG